MDAFGIISMCFGMCGPSTHEDTDGMPRWMRGQAPISTGENSENSEKQMQTQIQMHYRHDGRLSRSVQLDSPDDTADYVVSAIFAAKDDASAAAALETVRAKFEDEEAGGRAGAASAWKERVATLVFERVFGALRAMDIANHHDHDPEHPSFLDRTNKRLADMCGWVAETAPEIFEWSVDYVKEHREEVAVAIACAAAVAVLWELAPWALEALGFSFPGLRAGSAAARLMKRYMGYVPKGSWMSFFQRLGATWGRT